MAARKKDTPKNPPAQPANVRATLKGFKQYASMNGRISTSSPQYAERLKKLQDGILAEMKKTKTPRNPRSPRSTKGV